MGSVWRITFPSGWEMLYIYAHEGTAKVSVGAQVMRVVRQFSDILGSVAILWSFLHTDPDNTWVGQRRRSG